MTSGWFDNEHDICVKANGRHFDHLLKQTGYFQRHLPYPKLTEENARLSRTYLSKCSEFVLYTYQILCIIDAGIIKLEQITN